MRWRATVARVGALTQDWLVRLEPGRVAFNRGEYFEAHELWEDVWRVTTGAERVWIQGLI